MPYFTFTFREQVFQAQYHQVAGSSDTLYHITDLAENLQSLAKSDIILQVFDRNAIKPGWELGDAIADGLSQYLKGMNNF